jgi:hypothetical protein
MTEALTLTEIQRERIYNLLTTHEEEFKSLLAECSRRDSRDEGIPAILIVDDLTQADKRLRVPTLSDEALGAFYADLALAIGVLIEASGGDPDYPSICPAMSAIAEQAFAMVPFKIWETGIEGG